jgi:hypothetical protein
LLVLDATTKKIQAVLAASVATTQPDFFSTWRDITTSVYTPGDNNGALNNTTNVDVIVAPGASTQRVIDYIGIFNKDTLAVSPTIKLDVSGTPRTLWKGKLSAGELVTYCEGVGWKKYNARGEEIVDTGVVYMFGGSVTLNTSATTTTITDPRIVGGKSRVHLTPKTANAAGAALVLYTSSVVDGTATLTHNNSLLSDRTFDYEIITS